MENSKELRK